jgi:CheY-like chemotaxis protein
MLTSLDASPLPVEMRHSDAELRPRAAHILLVDDSPHDSALYAKYLAAAGFRVSVATNGHEGVALARSLGLDLIVMDLEMPIVDGWEAARILSSDERTSHVPMLVLSGHYDSADVMRALGAGCRRFVPKPCLGSELEGIIRSMLEEPR